MQSGRQQRSQTRSASGPIASTPPAPPAPAAPAPPTVAPQESAAASRPRTQPPPPKVDRLPPWRVILHNDDVNDIGHVVETIIELLRVNPRQALLSTLTAHRTGLCLLICTHRERAELLQDQFKCKSLKVTIEPEA